MILAAVNIGTDGAFEITSVCAVLCTQSAKRYSILTSRAKSWVSSRVLWSSTVCWYVGIPFELDPKLTNIQNSMATKYLAHLTKYFVFVNLGTTFGKDVDQRNQVPIDDIPDSYHHRFACEDPSF
jgi:hypothetical protein